MAGRPALPLELKILRGTAKQYPMAQNPAKPIVREPPMPSGLDPVAKEVWKRLAPIYVRLGMLTETDGEAFTALCEASAVLTRIRRAFRKGGYKVLLERRTVEVGKDESEATVEVIENRANPLIIQQRHAMQVLRFWCNEFGATPSSRGKINAPAGTSKESSADDFLDG